MAGTKLLPCPFCGGEAQVARTAAGYWAAYCEKPMCGRVGNFKTEAEAIEAWNTRYEPMMDAIPMTEENMRKRGWVKERTCQRIDDGGYSYRFECSVCGCVVIVHDCETRLDVLPNHCPNCGAKVVSE